MAFVYMLQGASGRYYIGCTEDLEARVTRHNSGHVHSSKRLGLPLVLVVHKEFPTMADARKIEAMLKRWKHSDKARAFLESGA
jgi:predicted GIY-YIG superfamily endonuclease